MTDFSLNPEVNIGNIFGELTPAKLRNLIIFTFHRLSSQSVEDNF